MCSFKIYGNTPTVPEEYPGQPNLPNMRYVLCSLVVNMVDRDHDKVSHVPRALGSQGLGFRGLWEPSALVIKGSGT